MRVAVMADIHSNYTALEKCLEFSFSKDVEAFIFLGDYCGEYPYPRRTMDRLYALTKEYPCFFVRGNKEDYWLNKKADTDCEWKNGNKSVGTLFYTYDEMRDEDFSFYESLKIDDRVEFEGCAPLRICHGSPRSNTEKIVPGKDETTKLAQSIEEDYILYGHTHVQREIKVDDKVLINPGAVGVALHSDGKTQMVIMESKECGWDYEYFQLEYDVQKVIDEIHASGVYDISPKWCDISIHLMRTGEVSHGTVLMKALALCEYKHPWYAIPDKYWDMAMEELFGHEYMTS